MNTSPLRAVARRIRTAAVSLLAAAILVFGGAGAAHAIATVQPGTVSVSNARVGVPVTVTADDWGPAGVSFAYQWRIDGTAVTGATASSYTPTDADAGKQLSVAVTGSSAGLGDETVVSASVLVGSRLHFTQDTPTVTGAASVGSVLTGDPGVIPADATATYQWYADNSDLIPGATGFTYTPTAADIGRVLHFCVTLRGAGYYDVSYGSLVTAPVTAAPVTSVSAVAATAGDAVTVSGQGFTGGEGIRIELHSTPVVLGNVTAASDGSFSTVVRIPAGTAAGAHTLRFFGATGRSAATPITVTAAPPAAAPAAAPAAPTPRARVAALADTGAEQSLGVALGGVLLLAAGSLMVAARHTRRA